MLDISLHSDKTGDWAAFVDESCARLGNGDHAALMPAHYLHVALPKIGGYGVTVQSVGQTCGYGFLFPRHIEGESAVYTLRYHTLVGMPAVNSDELTNQVSSQMPRLLDGQSRVIFYDPSASHAYGPSHHRFGALDIGRPDVAEAERVRAIQQLVWGSSADALYPVDIHSMEFALPVSLVARIDGQTAGFLFGMTKFGGGDLPLLWQERLNHRVRLESQLMAVLPEFRGRHIGLLFKKIQAEKAVANGIDIINWTADPLQFPNAVLNYTQLGAVAYELHPSLYAFHNVLNRVDASRFSMTWLPGTMRVRALLLDVAGERPNTILDLAGKAGIIRVNDGSVSARFDVNAPTIAFEIPANWNGLQQSNLPQAQRWRDMSDRLFAHYLGNEVGRYMITGTGKDGERCYLLGQRVDGQLLDLLSQIEGPEAK